MICFLSLLVVTVTAFKLKHCATVNANASANTPDTTPILVGGGAYSSPRQAVFMSASFAYAVDVLKQGKALSVTQAPMGSFQSTTGTVGIYDQTPLLLHVIPSGTTELHFLHIKNGRLTDYWQPMSLAHVLPKGFVPTASAVSHDPNLGLVEEVFFASADIVVRLCHNPFYPNLLGAYGVFNLSRHFNNPLGVDIATHVGVNEQTERMFVSRRRANSSPDEAADVVVLQLDASCGLIADNRVYVQPQPVSISVLEAMNNAGAFLYWPMSPDPSSGPSGRLYRWDLAGTGVANVSLDIGGNDVIAPVGFAETLVQMAFYGVVVSQTPGDSDVVGTLIDAGDPFHVNEFNVACKSRLAMGLPTAYAPVDNSMVIFASDGGDFSLVYVPDPTSMINGDESVVEPRKSVAPGQCPSFSFGLPPTCAACSPPSSLCGMTEHCDSGCCFVTGGRVMCCHQSPPGTAMPGFSCA
jgi:hypothetical protein